MPPATAHPSLHLQPLPRTFYVVQHDIKDTIPEDLLALLTGTKSGANFLSITRTAEEISIIGECGEGEEGDWKCIKIAGPMDLGGPYLIRLIRSYRAQHGYSLLGLTGIMCDFTTPLKHSEIPIFAMSTW